MRLVRLTFSLVTLLFLGPGLLARAASVRVSDGTIDLPTYALGEEDPNPPFPLVNRHQIYPYTMLHDLTDRREMKTYRAVFLENEYLKAIILPDLGGRLYSLYDKAADREVFYRNSVVKYGLVALRGAWISGGIQSGRYENAVQEKLVLGRLVDSQEKDGDRCFVGRPPIPWMATEISYPLQ